MKRTFTLGVILFACSHAFAQLLIDNQLQMTGATDAQRRITNLGAPVAATDAVSAGSVQQGALMFATATGSGGNYVITLSPAPVAYTPGMIVNFKANHANTGTATLKVGTLAAVTIKTGVTDDLASGDILSNQTVSVMYDGTNFQMLSRGATVTTLPPNGPAGGDLTGTYPNPTIAANAVASAEISNGTIVAADLAATGVSAGTYSSVTVNAQGQVTGGTNPAYTTGTGSSGHVTYWTGASTQSYDNGQLFWDATNNRLGIGTITPTQKLHVSGGAIVGNYALVPAYANWAAYGTGDGGAAIYNDNNTYKKLMIVGNNGAGGEREVGIWDNLTVNGGARISDLSGTGTRLVTASSNGTLTIGGIDARSVSGFQVTGMRASRKYQVCVYGVTENRGNDSETLGSIGVRNCSGTNLAVTATTNINWHDGAAPHSHCFVVTAPSDGCVRGFTDNGNALNMTVIQLE